MRPSLGEGPAKLERIGGGAAGNWYIPKINGLYNSSGENYYLPPGREARVPDIRLQVTVY